MKPGTLFLRTLFFMVMAAALSACTALAGEQETLLYLNDTPSYSVLYPADYQVNKVSERVLEISKDPADDDEQPRAYINTIPTSALTTETAADEYIANYPDDEIVRADITIDNEPAIQLDGIPGKELTRLVLIVHNGTLYKLNFTPADTQAGADYRKMEALYDIIVGSLDFEPEP